jgi:uncharacterized protein
LLKLLGGDILTYSVKIIKKQGQKTTKWSGGETTQLYIYPENTSYENKDFKWRLSSAKVESEKSTFTKLPNIQRKLMVIDGELILKHEGHKEVKLDKFEVDSFSGDLNTISYGIATDFNLMTNKDCIGELEYIKIKSDIVIKPKVNLSEDKYKYEFNFFYSLNGDFDILLESGKLLTVDKEDLAIIKMKKNSSEKFKLINKLQTDLQVIKSIVYY